jgi:hypothetical protein
VTVHCVVQIFIFGLRKRRRGVVTFKKKSGVTLRCFDLVFLFAFCVYLRMDFILEVRLQSFENRESFLNPQSKYSRKNSKGALITSHTSHMKKTFLAVQHRVLTEESLLKCHDNLCILLIPREFTGSLKEKSLHTAE